MKIMLKIFAPLAIAGLVALASCSTSTSPNTTTADAATILSQDSANYPNGCQLDSTTLRAELGLTDEQVARIVAVRDSLRAAEQAEITAANGDRETIHTILDKYRDALRTQIEAILTPDQITKLQALLAARGDGERHREGGHRGIRGGCFMMRDSVVLDSAFMARMTADLTLTDSQVVAIQTLAATVNADTTIADKGRAFMTGLQTILTSDQLTKLRELADAREPWEREGGRGGDDRHHGGRGGRGGHH